jgi:hypothetical protein
MNVKEYAKWLLSLPEKVQEIPVVVHHSRHRNDDGVDVRLFNALSHGIVHDFKGNPCMLIQPYADGIPLQADPDKPEVSVGEFSK